MGAQDIAQLKPKFDELNAKLICVGYEDVGAQEFLDGKFWQGELLVDQPHAVFQALGTRKVGLWTLGSPSVVSALSKAMRMGIPKNFEGSTLDGTLGGTYVVSNGEFVYEYQNQDFGDHAPGEEVLQACTYLVRGTGTMPAGKPKNASSGGCSVM